MTTLRHWVRFAVLASLVATPIKTALATPLVYTSGHADVGVGYDAGDLEPHWHVGAGAIVDGSALALDTEYEPIDLLARTASTRTTPSGGGGLVSLLGVPNGTTVRVAGSAAYQPNLGWGAEELDPLDWTGNITVTFNPLASTLPSLTAEFGMYTTNGAGTSIVDRIFSTYDPLATDNSNSFEIIPGDHSHFQWAFTELGSYDLNFTWSGNHASDGFKTATATFTVQAVPEPSTLAMLGIAGGAGLFAIVRQQTRRNRVPAD